MKIVVGLGNPGGQYLETRHNIGWMVLDRLADRAGSGGRGRERDASRVVQVRLRGLDLVLAKPLTYMNDSGIAVRKLLVRERAQPQQELLVVVDDEDDRFPAGRRRAPARPGEERVEVGPAEAAMPTGRVEGGQAPAVRPLADRALRDAEIGRGLAKGEPFAPLAPRIPPSPAGSAFSGHVKARAIYQA